METSSSAGAPGKVEGMKEKESAKRKTKDKPSKPQLKCEHCGKCFAACNGFNYRRHLTTHTGIKPHSCPHCQSTFSEAAKHHKHIITVHTMKAVGDKLPPGTTEPQLEATIQSLLDKHQVVGEKKSCALCDRLYPNLGNVRTHILERHLESLVPMLKNFPPCSSTSKNKTKRKVSPKKNNHDHECLKCRVTFSSKHCLTQHQKSHLPSGTRKCKFCDKSFTQDHHMKDHMAALHTWKYFKRKVPGTTEEELETAIKSVVQKGQIYPEEKNRRYGCPQCSKRVHRPYNLRMHILTKHFGGVIAELPSGIIKSGRGSPTESDKSDNVVVKQEIESDEGGMTDEEEEDNNQQIKVEPYHDSMTSNNSDSDAQEEYDGGVLFKVYFR